MFIQTPTSAATNNLGFCITGLFFVDYSISGGPNPSKVLPRRTLRDCWWGFHWLCPLAVAPTDNVRTLNEGANYGQCNFHVCLSPF